MSGNPSFPLRLKPMLATLTDKPFDDPAFVFETKWDCLRLVARLERGEVTAYFAQRASS